MKMNIEKKLTEIQKMTTKLERQHKALEQLAKLQTQQAEIERQMREVTKGSGVAVTGMARRSEREFARGTITFAVIEALKARKAGATVAEVVNDIVEKKLVDATHEALMPRVRNLLNSSTRFENVRRGVYKVAPNSKKLSGALFNRLNKEAHAVAA